MLFSNLSDRARRLSGRIYGAFRPLPWNVIADAVLLFLLALVPRLLLFGALHNQSPDEYFYVVLARDFWRVWTHQSPPVPMDTLHPAGFPLTVAAAFFMKGQATLEIGKSLGLFFNVLTVPVAYLLGRLCLPRSMALGAALLFSVFPAFFRDADRVWADHPATFFAAVYLLCAIRSWRTGKLAWWGAASLSLALTAWTKEYLIVLLAPVTLTGVLLHFKQRTGRFWLAAAGMTALCLGMIAWLQLYSGWLPRASYLEAVVKGVSQSRRDYLGFTPFPDLRKLYYQNLYETELPAVFLVLTIAGFLRALLSRENVRERRPVALTLMAVPVVFILYFSMFRNLFGARLLFPALPVIAMAVAAGLWPGRNLIPAGLIGFCGAAAFLPIRFLDDAGQISVQSGTGGALLCIAGAQTAAFLWEPERDRVLPHLRLAVFGFGILLCLGWAALYIGNSAIQQGETDRRLGKQSGFAEASNWIRRKIRPDDCILSKNPRLLAYYTGASSYRMASHVWWEEKYTQSEESYLRKQRIQWVVITRPEFSEATATRMYRHLKRRPYLAAAYVSGNEQSVALAFFRVRSRKAVPAVGHRPGLQRKKHHLSGAGAGSQRPYR